MFETILSGVFVFVLGQIFLKMVLEPINALKKSFADIAHGFFVNAPFIYNPKALNGDQKSIVRERLLSLSGNLHGSLHFVPCYKLWGWVFRMPKAQKIRDAAQCLVTISNWLHSDSNTAIEHIIKNYQDTTDALGIYVPPNSRVNDDLLNAAIRSSFGHG